VVCRNIPAAQRRLHPLRSSLRRMLLSYPIHAG